MKYEVLIKIHGNNIHDCGESMAEGCLLIPANNKDNKWLLIIANDEENCGDIIIEIDYCPFCGKKLLQ